MKRLLTLVLIGFSVTAFIACQSGATGLSDQDKAAIRKVVDDTTRMATTAKPDFAAYAKAYYTEDAAVLTSNMPAVEGRAAIQAMFESMPPMTEFKPVIVDLEGRGDVAYVRGSYTLTVAPPGAPAMTDQGKYIEVWKKGADGAWKARYDSWTSDLPVPGLLIPTGAPAATASAEIKKLGDMVGRWQIDGTVKLDPKGPGGPVALFRDCQWFASGTEVVCTYGGALAGQPFQEVNVYSYDATTKSYASYSVTNSGGAGPGTLAISPETMVYVSNATIAGKPARSRLTVTKTSTAAGTWMTEMSVAGGPWAPVGEGKYARAK